VVWFRSKTCLIKNQLFFRNQSGFGSYPVTTRFIMKTTSRCFSEFYLLFFLKFDSRCSYMSLFPSNFSYFSSIFYVPNNSMLSFLHQIHTHFNSSTFSSDFDFDSDLLNYGCDVHDDCMSRI